MTERLLQIIGRRHTLEKLDVSGFTPIRANGMRFTVEAYKAEGLGHVSVMRAKGFFGLMKMDTLIVNPTQKDLPLYSYDRIFAMGGDTLIAELYDTTVGGFSSPVTDKVASDAASLPERDPGAHWYDGMRLPQSLSKKGKKEHRSAFDELAAAHLSSWLNADCRPLTDPAAKREKTAVYVEGLLINGGPSTDAFKKALGKEKTEKLFRYALFGTGE